MQYLLSKALPHNVDGLLARRPCFISGYLGNVPKSSSKTICSAWANDTRVVPGYPKKKSPPPTRLSSSSSCHFSSQGTSPDLLRSSAPSGDISSHTSWLPWFPPMQTSIQLNPTESKLIAKAQMCFSWATFLTSLLCLGGAPNSDTWSYTMLYLLNPIESY